MREHEHGHCGAEPQVSIVLNSYNYAWCIADAVDSALAQQGVRVEVIVVDDGSSDNTLDVLAQYGHRIEVISQANAGQGAAINTGFRSSRAPWVLFLDADDRLHPLACAQALEAAGTGVAKVQFRLNVVDRRGRPLGYTHPSRGAATAPADAVPLLLHRGSYTTSMTSGNLFSRQTLSQILPIPVAEYAISADGYLNTAAAFHGTIRSLPQALGDYRLHGTNNWSMTTVNETRLVQFVSHNQDRYGLIRALAAERGLRVDPRMALNDPFHVRNRLVVSRLSGADPASADFGPTLSTGQLLLAGARAMFAEGPSIRSVSMSAWMVAVTATRGRVLDWLLRISYVPAARRRVFLGRSRAR